MAPQAARSRPVSPERPSNCMSMTWPLGRTLKRMATTPDLRMGGLTSSGISGSQVRCVM